MLRLIMRIWYMNSINCKSYGYREVGQNNTNGREFSLLLTSLVFHQFGLPILYIKISELKLCLQCMSIFVFAYKPIEPIDTHPLPLRNPRACIFVNQVIIRNMWGSEGYKGTVWTLGFSSEFIIPLGIFCQIWYFVTYFLFNPL